MEAGMKTFQELTQELESQGYEWRFITEPTEESAEGWEYLAGVAWHNSSGCFCVGMFYRRPKPVPAPKPERWLYAGCHCDSLTFGRKAHVWFYIHPLTNDDIAIFEPVTGFGGVEYAERPGEWFLSQAANLENKVTNWDRGVGCFALLTPRRVRIQNPEWRA